MIANPKFEKQDRPEWSAGKADSLFPRACEGFLKRPVPVVLAVLWLAGLTLMGLSALTLYLLWLLLHAVGD